MKSSFRDYLFNKGFLWGPEHNPYGVSGFMTYGPLGKKLKSNIEREFRNIFSREGFEEVETPILYPKLAWQASGHLEKFGKEIFRTMTSDGQEMYGRPEIATTIYPLFKNLASYYSMKLPFKIYQTGLVLPNDYQTEWQVRTRQYTAHEGHIFIDKKLVNVTTTITYLKNLAFELMLSIGLPKDKLIFKEKRLKDKPFYAKKAYALYAITGENTELEILGIQYRSNRDFEVHSKATGIKLNVGESYPEVFEISFSSDRPFYLILQYSLKNNGGRYVLQLADHLAPVSIMIFPLRNVLDLRKKTAELATLLAESGIKAQIIENGGIGKRYEKADAVGTPFVFTIDSASLKDNSFTLRDRDTRKQVRLSFLDISKAFLEFGLQTYPVEVIRKSFYSKCEEDGNGN